MYEIHLPMTGVGGSSDATEFLTPWKENCLQYKAAFDYQ